MKLPPLSLVVLDTETTGFVPRVNRVIEYASVTVKDGEPVDAYEQLFSVEEVPPAVEVITRIRTEDLRGQPTFEEKREEILSKIPADAVIVGQNTPFDLGMLKGEGIDLTERPWIDTSMLASLVFPELESYSLGYLSEVLSLNHEPKHRALGDVRATLELLSRVWERLLELPAARQEQAKEIMGRSSPGYRLLFAALPPTTAKKNPAWLNIESAADKDRPLRYTRNNAHRTGAADQPLLRLPKRGEIALREEPLDPLELSRIIDAAKKDASVRHSSAPFGRSEQRTPVRCWIAVKNLDAAVSRLVLDASVRVLYPPSHLLDPEAVGRLQSAGELTADESTLLLKLRWYSPITRNDLPLHGGEEAVWRGTLACTSASAAYRKQFEHLPGVVLIDHHQLLRFLEDEELRPAAAAALNDPSHIIIDDASMLEDTATKAYGWYADVSALRAGSERHPALTRFTDLLQLWIEKVRRSLDVRALASSDLGTPETKGLRTHLEDILAKPEGIPLPVLEQLACVRHILDPENLARRFAWIEQRQNGAHTLQSVPEHVADFLEDFLYSRFPTTLLIPPGSDEELREILPPKATVQVDRGSEPHALPVSFPLTTLAELFAHPPRGKTILLCSGKGVIENHFVRYAQALEERGIIMICQGMSGGQGRMRAEFLAAPAPALWLVTPWIFEGLELPPGSVDHLVVATLPFDYASHPVMSRRAARYRNGFSEYFLPRLTHRLFRLLRTFSRFKTDEGDVAILDDRLRSKGYGKEVIAYLKRFSVEAAPAEAGSVASVSKLPRPSVEEPPPSRPKRLQKKSAGAIEKKGQLKLF